MTTVRQAIQAYAFGKITFDELRDELAGRWYTHAQGEEMPGDNDWHWVDSAVTCRILTERQRLKLVRAVAGI